ncbi:uncharacterized protein [Elaeis guineensis]|uniref:uncharacterized protein isoform X2 n=1 Tax=Elaeis guineensis var. tenera TaxID=51953 RepID=UPI003C6D58A4
MAEKGAAASGGGGAALKDQGNEFFKAGNHLKAAALYTQAIKLEPNNPTLYSNRAAAFLHLVKLSKALADAEMTITLKPQWEKGYFRKGCILEAMERYDDSAKFGAEELWQDIFSFLVDIMESAIKAWHETGKVDPRVNFLLDKLKTQTDKYAPVVNIDKAFESPDTHSSCFTFLRQYAEESFARASCLIAPKDIISYPQVWKGQGSRKWKLGHSDGFFVQFESPVLRKLWFIPSSTEKGRTLCRNPEDLDISAHEVLPRLFKEPGSNVR